MPFRSKAQRRWMYANDPTMARRWEDETPDGELPDHVDEAGYYVQGGARPGDLDPNDRVRQQTHRRSKKFPYDRPTSYGGPDGIDNTGARYQQAGYGGQLTPWFMPDDDGDIEQADEAIGTPINFKQSDGGSNSGLLPPGQSRGWAGSTKDELDLPPHEVFGEDEWPAEVRRRGLTAMEEFVPMDLGECFAVYNEESEEVLSLMERLDWGV